MTSGLSERDQLQRLFAVGRLADDLDVGVAGEHVGDVPAVVRRVVDDEEPDGPVGGGRLAFTSESSGAGSRLASREGLSVHEVVPQV